MKGQAKPGAKTEKGGSAGTEASRDTAASHEVPGASGNSLSSRLSTATEAAIGSFKGGGEPLSPALRAYFEPRFRQDLSAVRLHTGEEATRASAEVGARAFAVGRDIAFGADQFRPESAAGRRLLAHELTHTLQQRATGQVRLQRSPLSDSVEAAWTAEPTLEALLSRLSRADVQGNQADADVETALGRLLAGRAQDLWVAERIRRGELGRTSGALGPKVAGRPVPRPVEAVFFRGVTTRRALVIAGVHGTERQGIEVARMLIADLQTRQPHFTVILVPSLFPDNAAVPPPVGEPGSRESGSTPTNRNFPRADQDLAAARAAGSGGRAVDAAGRRILAENEMLLELMERFHPERIISIHGTRRPGAAGVFFDPRSPSPDELQAAWAEAAERAAAHRPSRSDLYSEGGGEAVRSELREIYYQERVQELKSRAFDTDRDLSLAAARQIDTATTGITGRESRTWGREREASAVTTAESPGRQAHPSIAGNIGPTGAIDHAHWSGSGTGGVSLGEYAPARGMSVFTVEPPINRNTGDYPTARDPGVDQAERRIELQSYADAVRTVLLGR